MINFTFQYTTEMVFGHETELQVGELTGKYGGKKVLLHYGGGSIIRSGLLNTIKDRLQECGISFIELGGVKANPRLPMVREGIELCRKEHIDFILACGGGSVIDSAKAIALGAPNTEDIWNIFENGLQPEEALPVGVVLTMPATGSESGAGSVITREETNQKVLYGNLAIIPKFCIIDPDLYTTIPDSVSHPGICDMMSHVMERYFTSVDHTEFSDRICEAAMRTLISNTERLLHGENNYDIWAELAMIANWAHNGICASGRMADWSCHFMEHELSGFYDVVHGKGLAVLTPAWMKYIYKDHLPTFQQFAVKMMGVEDEPKHPEETARHGIERLEELFQRMGLPTSMSELGIPDRSRYEEMAKQAVGFGTPYQHDIGNIQKLDWQDIVEILKLAE